MVYVWYANNELVTGANLNQLITGGGHIVSYAWILILEIEILRFIIIHMFFVDPVSAQNL